MYIDSNQREWPITHVDEKKGYFTVDLGIDLEPSQRLSRRLRVANFCIGGIEGATQGDTIYLLLEGANLSLLNNHLLPIIATWQHNLDHSNGHRSLVVVESSVDKLIFLKHPSRLLHFTIRTRESPLVLTGKFTVSFRLDFS